MKKVITISVDEEGDFTYSPSLCNVSRDRGDQIAFRCEAGNFTVVFPDTPVGQISLHGRRGEETESFPVTAAKAGYYHYMVAIALKERVLMDVGCPLIVVR